MIRFDSSGKCYCLFPLLLLLLLVLLLLLLLLLPLALVEEAPAAAFCWTTTFLAILAQLEECVMLGLLLHHEVVRDVRSTPGWRHVQHPICMVMLLLLVAVYQGGVRVCLSMRFDYGDLGRIVQWWCSSSSARGYMRDAFAFLLYSW